MAVAHAPCASRARCATGTRFAPTSTGIGCPALEGGGVQPRVLFRIGIWRAAFSTPRALRFVVVLLEEIRALRGLDQMTVAAITKLDVSAARRTTQTIHGHEPHLVPLIRCITQAPRNSCAAVAKHATPIACFTCSLIDHSL